MTKSVLEFARVSSNTNNLLHTFGEKIGDGIGVPMLNAELVGYLFVSIEQTNDRLSTSLVRNF